MRFSPRGITMGTLTMVLLALLYFNYIVPGPANNFASALDTSSTASDNNSASDGSTPSVTPRVSATLGSTTPTKSQAVPSEAGPTGSPQTAAPGKVPPVVQQALATILRGFYSQPAGDTNESRKQRLAKLFSPAVLATLSDDDRAVTGDGNIGTPSFSLADMQASGAGGNLYVVVSVTVNFKTAKGESLNPVAFNCGSQWQQSKTGRWSNTGFTSVLVSSS